ncbi:glycerophosphodiester phosphodiesterase [Zhihengliuella alba]|uniref:Glycerophosphodiester phosphodiesterase n=2 Tax=Zhihengliuella alba TaxID=547018 RepID=A0ABP7DKQ2_9MICC
MAAFRAAVELGLTHLETDVRTTSDGHLVVFHDEELDRLTGETGRIADLTLDDLARVRVAGEPIPTFEELLTAWPHVELNVDLKDERSVRTLADAVIGHGAHGRVVAASFSDRRRRALRRELERRGSRQVRATAGMALVAAFTLLGKASRGGFQPWRLLRPFLRRIFALQVPIRKGPLTVVEPGFLARAHEAGLEVHVWVVDDAETMHRLLDLGVDGIMADRADVLVDVYRERGIWPPG